MSQRAVLIVNLGSPDSTSVPDVRRYLREFLGDERVLDLPAPLRFALLEGIILRTRPKKSAHAYASIWQAEGSPLVITSRSVRDKLAATLGAETPVYLAMRYGNPSIASVMAQMAADGVTEVLLFPQYPHYAMSSWETVVVKVFAERAKLAPGMHITTVQPFFQDADYIEALYQVTAPHLSQPHDHLLFSYHGIPERHLRKGDSSKAHCTLVADCCTTCSPAHATCYKAQCVKTTQARTRRSRRHCRRQTLRFLSVPPRRRTLALAVHRLRAQAPAPSRQETLAHYLPRLRRRLPRNHRGNLRRGPRRFHGRRRRIVPTNPLLERSKALHRISRPASRSLA